MTVAQAADPAFQAGVVGDFLREEHDRPRAFLDIPMLHANGLLFVGHSENFFHAADIFRLRGKTVYELASTSKARLE